MIRHDLSPYRAGQLLRVTSGPYAGRTARVSPFSYVCPQAGVQIVLQVHHAGHWEDIGRDSAAVIARMTEAASTLTGRRAAEHRISRTVRAQLMDLHAVCILRGRYRVANLIHAELDERDEEARFRSDTPCLDPAPWTYEY